MDPLDYILCHAQSKGGLGGRREGGGEGGGVGGHGVGEGALVSLYFTPAHMISLGRVHDDQHDLYVLLVPSTCILAHCQIEGPDRREVISRVAKRA